MPGKKTYKDGNIYEDGVYRGPVGGSGVYYPYRDAIKKYWSLIIGLIILAVIVIYI